MFEKCFPTIKFILLIGTLLLIPCSIFPQEKVADQAGVENFGAMISKINSMVVKFGNELKATRVSNITKMPGPLAGITLGEYQKFGTTASGGTEFFLRNDILVPPGTPYTTTQIIPQKVNWEIIDWITRKYNDFYKEIYPVLTETCRALKNSPVRLENVSIELAPLGIGGSVTIGVNYESPWFGK
jgi:hypothetical protein